MHHQIDWLAGMRTTPSGRNQWLLPSKTTYHERLKTHCKLAHHIHSPLLHLFWYNYILNEFLKNEQFKNLNTIILFFPTQEIFNIGCTILTSSYFCLHWLLYHHPWNMVSVGTAVEMFAGTGTLSSSIFSTRSATLKSCIDQSFQHCHGAQAW